MGNAKSILSAINRTFSSEGGVMWRNVKDSHMSQYWMKDLQKYLARPKEQQNRKKAALTLGKQPLDDVYVLGEGIQMDGYGNVIGEDDQYYIYMTPYAKSLPVTSADKSRLQELFRINPVPLPPLPLLEFDWWDFIKTAKEFMGHNFFSFVMMLTGGLTAFHFNKVLNLIGSCPAAMAVGGTGSGKTTSLKLIARLLGGSFMSQCSGESVTSELMKSSFPVYWDDPSHASVLEKVLVSTFQGAGKQTKSSGNEMPLTTFLLSVNFQLENFRLSERTTPVHFQKYMVVRDESSILELSDINSKASTACLPSVIRMGRCFGLVSIQSHINFFRERLLGLPSRLPDLYSCYRYFAKEVIDLVSDDEVISEDDFDNYLCKEFLPYVQSLYDNTKKVQQTLHQMMEDLISSVDKGFGRQVDTWLRASVGQRGGQGAAVHINKADLIRLLKDGGTPYSSANISAILKDVQGAHNDFRSDFGLKKRQIANPP